MRDSDHRSFDILFLDGGNSEDLPDRTVFCQRGHKTIDANDSRDSTENSVGLMKKKIDGRENESNNAKSLVECSDIGFHIHYLPIERL